MSDKMKVWINPNSPVKELIEELFSNVEHEKVDAPPWPNPELPPVIASEPRPRPSAICRHGPGRGARTRMVDFIQVHMVDPDPEDPGA